MYNFVHFWHSAPNQFASGSIWARWYPKFVWQYIPCAAYILLPQKCNIFNILFSKYYV